MTRDSSHVVCGGNISNGGFGFGTRPPIHRRQIYHSAASSAVHRLQLEPVAASTSAAHGSRRISGGVKFSSALQVGVVTAAVVLLQPRAEAKSAHAHLRQEQSAAQRQQYHPGAVVVLGRRAKVHSEVADDLGCHVRILERA